MGLKIVGILKLMTKTHSITVYYSVRCTEQENVSLFLYFNITEGNASWLNELSMKKVHNLWARAQIPKTESTHNMAYLTPVEHLRPLHQYHHRHLYVDLCHK